MVISYRRFGSGNFLATLRESQFLADVSEVVYLTAVSEMVVSYRRFEVDVPYRGFGNGCFLPTFRKRLFLSDVSGQPTCTETSVRNYTTIHCIITQKSAIIKHAHRSFLRKINSHSHITPNITSIERLLLGV